MARYRNARRLRAVFLWAFSGMTLMLFLVIAAWFSTFAQVSRANAQPALQCHPSNGTIDDLRLDAGEIGFVFYELTALEADRYISELISTRPAGSEGLRAVAAVFPNGRVLLAMMQGGILCTPYLRTVPREHERALDAAVGVAS